MNNSNHQATQPAQNLPTADAPGNIVALLLNQLLQSQQNNSNGLQHNSAAPAALFPSHPLNVGPAQSTSQGVSAPPSGSVAAGPNNAGLFAPVMGQLGLSIPTTNATVNANASSNASQQLADAQNSETGGEKKDQDEMKVRIDKAKELLTNQAPVAAQDLPEVPVPPAPPATSREQCTIVGEAEDKDPESVAIVPCRARGMPMDHNFKTAYFVISGKVKHGEQLVCSYPACRNGGVKFRYCSTCKIPVAKRNFRNRHNHKETDTQGSAATADVPDAKTMSSKPTEKKSKRSSNKVRQSSSTDRHGGKRDDKYNTNDGKNVKRPSRKESIAAASLPPRYGNGRELNDERRDGKESRPRKRHRRISGEKGDKGINDHRRQKAWIALLAKRPLSDDDDGMSAWLMEVLAVSDNGQKAKSKPPKDPPEQSRMRLKRKRQGSSRYGKKRSHRKKQTHSSSSSSASISSAELAPKGSSSDPTCSDVGSFTSGGGGADGDNSLGSGTHGNSSLRRRRQRQSAAEQPSSPSSSSSSSSSTREVAVTSGSGSPPTQQKQKYHRIKDMSGGESNRTNEKQIDTTNVTDQRHTSEAVPNHPSTKRESKTE